MTARVTAAETERHTLLAQAAERHLSDLRDAARRYEAELAQIETTYQMRVG